MTKIQIDRLSLTRDGLRELLRYEPSTGKFFWLINIGKARKGSEAGSIDSFGYRVIGIRRHDYRAHRLAWLDMHGEWPDLHIDHINGDRSDNRLSNLRQATQAQNMSNARKRIDQPIAKGVYLQKKTGKYRASIASNKKSYYLGVFGSLAEASKAYAEASQKLHGEFARTE